MSYRQYVSSLKAIAESSTPQDFPKLIVLTGPSQFLRLKAMSMLKSKWDKFEGSSSQSIESSEIEQIHFVNFLIQANLFEPDALYILRRAASIKNLSAWFSGIKNSGQLKAHVIVDGADKLTADLSKQALRLDGVVVRCEEPDNAAEFFTVARALASRLRLTLEDSALRYLFDATGLDLGRVENELIKLSLRFSEENRALKIHDLAPSIGCMREDDVFELFNLLRGKRSSLTHLKAENFLNRGESAIAMTGIFARFAREQVEKNATAIGVAGIKECARIDQLLKSSKIDESLMLSRVIEAMRAVPYAE